MTDPATQRLEMDAGAERATGRLRLVGAVVVGLAVIWLASTDPGVIGWVFVVLGGFASLGWVASWRGGRKRIRGANEYFLELGPGGLLLAEGDDRHQIPWREVTDVEVDEERLVVLVGRRTQDPLAVQPRYRGLGIHDLGATIQRAWEGARARDDG